MLKSRLQHERILDLLRGAEGFVSGEQISKELRISRAAVWKLIQRLRRQGYRIQGVSSMGYRLRGIADSLGVLELDPGICTNRIGGTIRFVQETGSTNDDLWELACGGAHEGTVVLAESQRTGKGRLGRRWISPPGENIYMSVLFRPPFPPSEASVITMMAAVALCRAVEETFLLRPGIKWPNDLLLEGKKAAGILAEMHAEQDRIHFLVLGVGVNLNAHPGAELGDLRYPATSVQSVLGRPAQRVPFVRRLLESLDEGYESLLAGMKSRVLDEWCRYCAHVGGWLEVSTASGSLRGRFVGLDGEGSMVLETPSGRKETIRAGDVIRVFPEARGGEAVGPGRKPGCPG